MKRALAAKICMMHLLLFSFFLDVFSLQHKKTQNTLKKKENFCVHAIAHCKLNGQDPRYQWRASRLPSQDHGVELGLDCTNENVGYEDQ